MGGTVLVSLSWASTVDPDPTLPVVWSVRASDWGLTGLRRRWHHAREAVRLARSARGFKWVVICTAGMEAVTVPLLRPLLCRGTRVAVVDFLMPPTLLRVGFLRSLLRQVDRWVVIRSGDGPFLEEKVGVAPSRWRFVPWPAPEGVEPSSVDEGFVYAAGSAQRDWAMLEQALAGTGLRCVVAGPVDVAGAENLGPLSPAEGRHWLSRCGVVAVPFVDNDLPSGPLIVLDALAMGKPVVATATRGAVDYVDDGTTGSLVPAGDAASLRDALVVLSADEGLRRRMGAAAHDSARRFTLRRLWTGVLEALELDSEALDRR